MYVTFGSCILRSSSHAFAATLHPGDHTTGGGVANATGNTITIAGQPNNTGDRAAANDCPATPIAHLQRSEHRFLFAVIVQCVLGAGQFQQECARTKCPSAGADLAGRDISILMAFGHRHIPGVRTDCVRVRVQALGISRNHLTLDVHVLLADFTEERFSWRTHFTHSQNNTGRFDRLRLCIRIH